MADPHAAGENKPDVSSDEAPLVPDAAADHAAEAAAVAGEVVAPAPSKEIVLQRLTSHSSWEDVVFSEASEPEPVPQRRVLSTMAIVVLAAAVGAAGGALATVGLSHALKNDQAVVTAAEQGRSVDTVIARISAEIAALKTGSAAQSAKIVERIDRMEKAQAEPAARLAKLSEAVEKLRAQEATGAIAKPAAAPAPAPAASAPNRLPLVDGWVLREVADGIATVQGRPGIFDVIPGDPLPGVGRVDAIRRQDGRWVVVTSRGLIVAR